MRDPPCTDFASARFLLVNEPTHVGTAFGVEIGVFAILCGGPHLRLFERWYFEVEGTGLMAEFQCVHLVDLAVEAGNFKVLIGAEFGKVIPRRSSFRERTAVFVVSPLHTPAPISKPPEVKHGNAFYLLDVKPSEHKKRRQERATPERR